MSGATPAEILRLLAPPDAASSDGELLRRFAAGRDQGAFAELVRRHGPLVLTVCRRVAGHPQDAEDAFQAAFLVLARKAAVVAHPDRLGNWLYGVAVRVSRVARRSAARRRAREVQVTAMPDTPTVCPDLTPDVGVAVHEELDRLPGWNRDAVLLCDLQGVSRTDAAKTLGIPEGTLSSRLAAGRKKLAERLARRGIVLAAAAVPSVLGEGAAFAVVPDSLVRKTCGLVADWTAGGAVPAPVHTLLDGGFTVRKLLLLGLVVAAVTATGIAVMAQPKESSSPIPPPNAIAAADATPNAEPAPVVIEKPDEKPVALGVPRMRSAIDLPVARIEQFAWAPDGKGLVIRDGQRAREGAAAAEPPRNSLLYIPDVTAESPRDVWRVLRPGETLVGFSPDGKSIVTAIREYSLVSGFHKLFYLTPPLTFPEWKVAKTLELDAEKTFGYAFSPDGKTFRTLYRPLTTPSVISLVEVWEIDATSGKRVRTLGKAEGEFIDVVFAPNGSKFAVVNVDRSLTVFDASNGAKLWAAPKPNANLPVRWSPTFSNDGKLLLLEGRLSSGGPPRAVKPQLLNAGTGEESKPFDAPDPIISNPSPPAFSSDGRLVAISGVRYTRREGAEQPGRIPDQEGPFTCVWDTTTGKILKSWHHTTRVSFLPNAPVLAVFESNIGGGMRLGLWDFAADAPEKK